MKKVIMLNFCNGMYGGIESFLLNAFFCLDKTDYDVTFLTCGQSTYTMYKDEIINNNGQVDEIPILANNYINKVKVYNALRRYFKYNQPDIVHINSGTLSLQLIASLAAKQEKVNKVIIHSHNFLPNKKGFKQLVKSPFKSLLCVFGDYYLACSLGAAYWMFPKEKVNDKSVIIIPNGVDTKRFLFDENKRVAFRNEFNFMNQLLIGNIGRFQGQKNHVFMLRIMQEVERINDSAKLLLVGEGELKDSIIRQANEMGVQDRIMFLGERKDMDSFLSAIDVFILPSIYEGLPIASVEAQASGAKTILSDAITKEANVSGSAIYLPISNTEDAKAWAQEICSMTIINRIEENKKVFNAGFDVQTCYNKMIQIYDE